MEKPTIFLDLDGIVADAEGEFIDRHNKRYGTNFTKEDVIFDSEHYAHLPIDDNDWNGAYSFEKFPANKLFKLEEYLHEDGVFKDLKPLPGAVEAVKKLEEMGDLYVVTATSRNTDSATDKMNWVPSVLGISRKRVILCKQKWFLRADERTIYVDDWYSNLINFRKHNPRAFIATIAYPHNDLGDAILDVRAEGRLDTAKAWQTLLVAIEEYIRYL